MLDIVIIEPSVVEAGNRKVDERVKKGWGVCVLLKETVAGN